MGQERSVGGWRGGALLIAGPTASGKSALAVTLAERFGGAVINADSMQVYADIPLLSAQPTVADRARVPHLLFGHIDGEAPFSVGRWLAEAEAAIRQARQDGRLPILVGGTGLYFKALTQGLSAIPAVPTSIRTRLRQEAEGVSPEALHARLSALDPVAAARLRPSDPQRILRALEVFEATGRSITEFQAAREAPALPIEEALAFVLMPDRDALKRQIDRRFEAMMAAGALEEARRLASRQLDPALPVMRALGVPPLLAHLQGSMTRDVAVATATRDTRAYARRQMTFARHQLPGFTPVTPEDAIGRITTAMAQPGG